MGAGLNPWKHRLDYILTGRSHGVRKENLRHTNKWRPGMRQRKTRFFNGGKQEAGLLPGPSKKRMKSGSSRRRSTLREPPSCETYLLTSAVNKKKKRVCEEKYEMIKK